MPAVVFILDTSGSMSTRAHPKFSFFDYAKNYIEMFVKGRTRNDSRNMAAGRENDRYFLLTTGGKYPENVKILSDKNPGSVIEELKKITLPFGNNPIHQTILDAFRVLLVNRAQTGIDGYGTGRAPQNSENVLVVVLTDGSGVAAIPNDFKLQFDHPFLGSEMVREAFRWDQKLFTVVYRIPSTPYRPTVSQLNCIDIDLPSIEKICATTGGRSFSIVSTRQIGTSIDAILSTAYQHKIGVRFDVLPALHFTAGRNPSEDSSKLRAKFKNFQLKRPVTNLISRLNPQGRPVSCNWPIPENYYPVRNQEMLPSRTAHPIILVAPEPLPFIINHDVPCDKLEVEPCAIVEVMMEMLLGRKDMCIWTYMEGASNGPTSPFGCLRLNATGTGITLVLLPYNFPMLYPLVDEIVRDPQLAGSLVFRQKLESYFQTVPYYYFNSMRAFLMDKLKVRTDITGSMSSIYTPQLLSNLNRLKVKAKEEWDGVVNAAKLAEKKSYKMHDPSIRIERITSRTSIVGLAGIDDDDHEEENMDNVDTGPIYAGEYPHVFQIALYPPNVNDPELDHVYKTPLISSIDDMVSKLNRIQANIDLLFDPDQPTLLDMARLGTKPRFNTLDELHNMPLKTMGEYEPYQMSQLKYYGPPLRRIEEEKERSHAFGNPYKLKGLGAGGIDEVMDSAIVDSNSKSEGKRHGEPRHQGGGPPKRRRGPLGIDAFDKWRTARSMRGSSAASDTSEDISSVLSDLQAEDDLIILGEISGPGTSSGASTPTSEFEHLHVKGGGDELQEMDSMEMLQQNLEEVLRRREEEKLEARSSSDVQLVKQISVESLTSAQIFDRKRQIGAIVRRPANLPDRAYDEIMQLATGITKETSDVLVRYAMRESQRFKVKQLTEKLEKRLKTS